MYIVLVYDIDSARVSKVCKYLRQHLTWVQNSVFEGEISKGRLETVKSNLHKLICSNYDSILIYQMESSKWVNRQTIGIEKNEISNLL